MAWLDSLEDGERAAAVAKGWDKHDGDAAARAIFGSYRAIEKMPRPEAAPNSAEAYKFDGVKLRDGKDPDGEFLGFARNLAHELGLPVSKAPVLAEKLLRYGDAADDAATAAAAKQLEDGTAALKTKWGADFEKNNDVAGRAFDALGLPKDMVDALVEKVGIDKVMEIGHGLGQKMGEATFLKGDHKGPQDKPMDKTQALIERNKLMSDPVFGKKIIDGDPEAVARLEQLAKDIVGTPDNWEAHPDNFGRQPGPNYTEVFKP